MPSAPIRFEAEPFHYTIADQELLDDLAKVARKIDAPTVLPQQYKKHGRFSATVFRQRFGSWNAALEKSALQPCAQRRVSNTAMSRDIAAVAASKGSTDLSRGDYVLYGKYGATTVALRFGGWSAAKVAAGLIVAPVSPRNLSNEELFDNFEQLWRTLGRQPRGRDVAHPHSRYDLRTYQTHFGTFRKALALFIARQKQAGLTSAPCKPLEMVIQHKTLREVRVALRYQILKRDRFRCCACGRSSATDPAVQLQVDHIRPWSQGGETTADNLQTLCDTCNAGKSNVYTPHGALGVNWKARKLADA